MRYSDSLMSDLARLRQDDLRRQADHHRLARSARPHRARSFAAVANWLRGRLVRAHPAGRKVAAAPSNTST